MYKDLPRTFSSLMFFHNGGPLQESLKIVLSSYAVYRPDLGYVQGMNYLAAMLLLNVDEFDAFVMMANLLHTQHFLGFFRMDMEEIKKGTGVFEQLLKMQAPKVFANFRKHNLVPDMYLLDWLFTLFSRKLPIDIASRVWDSYLLEGEVVMYRMAISIIKMMEKSLQEGCFEDCIMRVNALPEEVLDEDILFKTLEKVSQQIPTSLFLSLKEGLGEVGKKSLRRGKSSRQLNV
mmetsp:Transcript_43338/g.112718  ORF Transcript_43338/g.112718 Transcript_43338/m.112718 type:complete len:233 (+) Transcript_43338:1350-2048(+)